ncbi:LacI family DNA-binding transcriptional regulator [Niabella terrae]
MKRNVTIKDIARKLNMSVSTVSKALNNNPLISSLTRDRVQELARSWNYIPNEVARHFQQSKSFTIGVIMPDLLDQFYVLAVNGIEQVAGSNNYNVIVSQTHEDSQLEEKLVQNMIKNRVDGVIITASRNTRCTDVFKRLSNAGIPFVLFARSYPEPEFDYVSTDNIRGAASAVEFLLKRGHRRIAHFMGPSFLKTSLQRLEGYQEALLQYGIGYDPALVTEVDLTREQTFAATHAVMKLAQPPTAFFTFKNYIGLDIIKVFKEHYPDRLKDTDVAGFGNLPLIEYLDYKPAAAIDESPFEMGLKAAGLIFDHIAGNEILQENTPKHIKVPCRLIEY